MDKEMFAYWRSRSTAAYHFPMDADIWQRSMEEDTDSDGRLLFDDLTTREIRADGKICSMIQYGRTAFGFDDSGKISPAIHHSVIRTLIFDDPAAGNTLLQAAMTALGNKERIYAFFHYFGMSACARHGKLHESYPQVQKLLMENGFAVEHENIYYSRMLQADDGENTAIHLEWKPISKGDCREFAALNGETEVGWGQVHFLPQKNIAYLRWVYIDEKQQHQGYGTGTMKALFAELYANGIRRFDTDTALNNTIAQAFYEKNGFKNEGITRSYYTK